MTDPGLLSLYRQQSGGQIISMGLQWEDVLAHPYEEKLPLNFSK
jgi:hypothetical protein